MTVDKLRSPPVQQLADWKRGAASEHCWSHQETWTHTQPTSSDPPLTTRQHTYIQRGKGRFLIWNYQCTKNRGSYTVLLTNSKTLVVRSQVQLTQLHNQLQQWRSWCENHLKWSEPITQWSRGLCDVL